MVGQILAVRHPELLARMAIGNTAYADSWPVLPIRIFRMLARMRLFSLIAAAGLPPRDPYTNWVLRRAFADPAAFSAGDRRPRIFFDTKFTDPDGRREFAAHLRALDSRDTLAIVGGLNELRLPTLIVWGVADRYQPWETVGRRLAAAIPDTDVRLLTDAGHFAMLDQPVAYVSALLGWRPTTSR
jgi:pimeloyl-ACP methyl ester carboxylesterase